jgi:MtN3 and saliva related transmembrane protein
MSEIIGWTASLILVATLSKQVHKQWREKTSEGISTWLFIGQLAASTGFVIYSVMTGSAVFVFTNSVLTITNLVGLYLYFRYRDPENNGASKNESRQ